MLLDRYGDTLEHLSYNTVTPGPLSGDEEWQCPLLPRLIKLHTDGVYFDFQSPHIILHNCPHLEELIMYQRNPEKVVSDFISQIDVMPLSLRKVVFSSDVDEGQQSGFRPINSELVIVASQVGQARNIEVIFGKPDRGESMA
ncbi:hypothetical protein FRC02_007774 [Tulasnella sp. 418]|nr:hypothetical protein FRC02_007774 [Tulasnella sp. 418]